MREIRDLITFVLFSIGLGATLVVYAHSTFATKTTVEKMHDAIIRIDRRVYDLHLRNGFRDDKNLQKRFNR